MEERRDEESRQGPQKSMLASRSPWAKVLHRSEMQARAMLEDLLSRARLLNYLFRGSMDFLKRHER